MMIETQKLNESYSLIKGPLDQLREISDFLKAERPDAWYDSEVKRGLKSPYKYFSLVHNKMLMVMNGHVDLLGNFGVPKLEKNSEFSETEIDDFLNDIKKILPFEPYDFQEKAFKESLLTGKQINKMCTGSGKSMTIGLMVEFLRRKGKKGLILVPNINLLTQLSKDFKDYNLHTLFEDIHIIGGGNSDRHFNNSLTISTWQSMLNYKEDLDKLDYVITDEAHRFASEETSSIVRETINCKYKWGFTGTLPGDNVSKMELFGLFGLPKTYITSKELIRRGLATPININSIIFNYPSDDRNIIRAASGFNKKLKFIKEYEKRNNFIVNLTCKLKNNGNSLVLFQHTEHGKLLFIETMKKLYPDVEVKNKDITGKKSFEFQEKYGVYFLNGEDNGETREKTRQILEDHEDATLIANYSLLSTGVNIKKLHNMILASPLRSYTTITQSIGRLMRLHPSKTVANVYDLVDNIGVRKVSGPFVNQYKDRCKTSYYPEEHPIKEVYYNL